MSTTVELSRAGRERTEAVSGLFDALIAFSRSLKARGADWSQLSDDLSRGDIVTLGVLDAHGSIRPGHIAAKLSVDPSVVSRQLAGLHRLGLVERGADPADRRAELISLTATGRERLLQARDAMCAALADRLDHWGLDEVRTATAMVEDLGHRLHEPLARPPAAGATTDHPTRTTAAKDTP